MKRKMDFFSSKQAFSRLELVAVLAALGLLAGVALPGLASNKLRSEQVTCLSNLRQLGHAAQLWANEHGDRTPWATPETEGGTRDLANGLRQNPWFQIGWMSNELVTPKILVCPSDQAGVPRKMANDFSNRPGGFFSTGFRNASLSYFAGLHADFEISRTIFSGDRNIRWDLSNTSCALGLSGVAALDQGHSRALWTNSIHGLTGNILQSDGSVDEFSSARLQHLESVGDANGIDHFLAPL